MSPGGAVSGAALGAALLLSACVSAPRDAGAAEAPASAASYLTPEALTRIAAAVPAPSADGSAEQTSDRALSERYRVFENSDRWLLATAHADLDPDRALQHFDCALGVRFAGSATPRLKAVFARLLHDANAAAEMAKTRAFRPRPVGVDPQRASCQRSSAASRASPSYPSGSAAVGAAYGAAMARIAPDQADAAGAIGHQIGVSRVVCGMHYPADAAAGEAVGRAVFEAVAATPAFRADLAAARAELATVRAGGLTNPGCAAERAALAVALP